MTNKIVRYLKEYRQRLIMDYSALMEREKRDHDTEAGEEAKRLIREIIDLKDLCARMGRNRPQG